MKRTTLTICASLMLLRLITTVQAQVNPPSANPTGVAPAGSPPGAANPIGIAPAPGAGPVARPMMPDRTDMYARMLNLTDAQKAKVRPILDEEAKKMQEIREQTQEKMKAILTPEQWTKYYRPAPRLGMNISATNAPTALPPVPSAPATPK